jgi:hypothetical protein
MLNRALLTPPKEKILLNRIEHQFEKQYRSIGKHPENTNHQDDLNSKKTSWTKAKSRL